MKDSINITIDGRKLTVEAGLTIMEAARDSNIYIPHLCYHPELKPHGSCRVCTVKVNGKYMASCTTPAENGMEIVNDGDKELTDFRKAVVEMLFVEGNHYCMFCEMSGKCELQAIAYRLGVMVPRYPYQFPMREVDASHPDIFFDRNRCIKCGRCASASSDIDGKHVFEITGRGAESTLSFDSDNGLGASSLAVEDRAVDVCPVGAILEKNTAYRIPYGERPYDHEPISLDNLPDG